VIDLEGQTHYAQKLSDLPALFQEVADAWADALEAGSQFADIQQAIRDRDVPRLKELWNTLVPLWDDRTFYDFVATSKAFAKLSFHHREVFGQVGFGTGGWDSDFPNSMLEIFRVVMTNCDDHQHLVVGGVEQVPLGIWRHVPERCAHWPAGTSLASLHSGAPRAGVKKIAHAPDGRFAVTDNWGDTREYAAVLTTCQSWLLTTQIECDETLFSQKMWMALDRTRYMQSSKTFVMVDRPFWKDKDPETGRDLMSMTLTDRLTRGTYLFDNGDDKPGRDLPVVLVDERRAENAPAPGGKARETGTGCTEKDLPESRYRRTHHRRSDHRVLGSRPALPRRFQRRPARPLPLQPAHVRALHAGRHACRTARDFHRWRRRVVDAGVGRRRGADFAQRGVGHHETLRRCNSRREPGSG
jgi:hypothetical protein